MRTEICVGCYFRDFLSQRGSKHPKINLSFVILSKPSWGFFWSEGWCRIQRYNTLGSRAAKLGPIFTGGGITFLQQLHTQRHIFPQMPGRDLPLIIGKYVWVFFLCVGKAVNERMFWKSLIHWVAVSQKPLDSTSHIHLNMHTRRHLLIAFLQGNLQSKSRNKDKAENQYPENVTGTKQHSKTHFKMAAE